MNYVTAFREGKGNIFNKSTLWEIHVSKIILILYITLKFIEILQ